MTIDRRKFVQAAGGGTALAIDDLTLALLMIFAFVGPHPKHLPCGA